MPEVKRRIDLESEKHKFVYEYKCDCGKIIILKQESKPEKLIKCFDCIGKMESI